MEVLSSNEIEAKLKELSGWSFENNSISREFKLKDFKSALAFVNAIGKVAEEMDHHPDMFIHGWNNVKITISTHSAGGVTQNDFTLANRIEKI